MPYEVRLTAPGGPERLETVECGVAMPGADQLRIRHTAIGVNFIDIYHRIGLYGLPALPAVLGVEAAGVVDAVGSGVMGFQTGDRVAYAGAPVGAYASHRLLPAVRAIKLSATVSDRDAAASLVRGLTAHMLLHRTYHVTAGTTVLVHAGAGGLGQILTAWAKRLGATVIATVGSTAKVAIARRAGADHVLLHTDPALEEAVKRLTAGLGVHVAYDGIGGDMLQRTLGCVRPFGTVASVGQAAGPIPALDVEALGPRRALTLARPSIMAYSADIETYRHGADELFDTGLRIPIGAEYGLRDAAQAQADLEAGRTTGSVVLIP